jgi:hypothetical protein
MSELKKTFIRNFSAINKKYVVLNGVSMMKTSLPLEAMTINYLFGLSIAILIKLNSLSIKLL